MPAMDVGDIPIFAMLKSRLGYLTERQKLIAQNVANANTPGYVAKDLKAFSFQSHVQAASGSGAGASVAATPPGMLAITQPGHLQPHASMHGMKAVATPDSEKSIDGWAVPSRSWPNRTNRRCCARWWLSGWDGQRFRWSSPDSSSASAPWSNAGSWSLGAATPLPSQRP